LSTTVQTVPHFWSCDVIGHVTIRSAVGVIGGPLTTTLYLASLLRY